MNTTIDYLNAVKAKTGAASDYALAKKLGTSRQVISNYMKKDRVFTDEIALRVAYLLGIEPVLVLASLHAELSRNEETKAVWNTLFERLGGLDVKLPKLVITRATGDVASDKVYIM